MLLSSDLLLSPKQYFSFTTANHSIVLKSFIDDSVPGSVTFLGGALWVEARYCHQVTPRTLLNREYLTYRLAQGLVVSYCGALVMHIYRNLLHKENSEVKRMIGF